MFLILDTSCEYTLKLIWEEEGKKKKTTHLSVKKVRIVIRSSNKVV